MTKIKLVLALYQKCFTSFHEMYLDIMESEALCSLKSATIALYFNYCIGSYTE